MGINSESDIAASLQIGPTDLGMVRVYIEADGVSLPLDFAPDEADEITSELNAAAERARKSGTQSDTDERPARRRKKSRRSKQAKGASGT